MILWSKAHLPLFLMAIPLAIMFLFLAVPFAIQALRTPRPRYVEVTSLMLTDCLVVLLALTLFSLAEWTFHQAKYGAVTTALASATALVTLLLKHPGKSVINFEPGRLLLKFRLWTLAEVFVLFGSYALTLALD
jgi:hypothetical protein